MGKCNQKEELNSLWVLVTIGDLYKQACVMVS